MPGPSVPSGIRVILSCPFVGEVYIYKGISMCKGASLCPRGRMTRHEKLVGGKAPLRADRPHLPAPLFPSGAGGGVSVGVSGRAGTSSFSLGISMCTPSAHVNKLVFLLLLCAFVMGSQPRAQRRGKVFFLLDRIFAAVSALSASLSAPELRKQENYLLAPPKPLSQRRVCRIISPTPR